MSRSRDVPLPQHDFITGNEASPRRRSVRAPFRSTSNVELDESNELLRNELQRLKYEVDGLKQERQLTEVRHREDLRAVQAKAEADYKPAQPSESSTNAASNKYEALQRGHREAEERTAEEKMDLERKLQTLTETNTALEERVKEREFIVTDQERQHKHELNELKTGVEPLQKEAETLRGERDERSRLLKTPQASLLRREEEVGTLQAEIMRLQAQAGDTDTLALIKHELSEQVAHIRHLESQTTKQQVELKQFREQRRAIKVVEEEKRALESKLEIMYDLRKELGEAQLQKQILEDERRSWSSFLASESSEGDEMRFDSPEALAKAFIRVRLEKLSLVDQCGRIREELDEKHAAVQTLEDKCQRLAIDVESARASASTSGSATACNSIITYDSKMRNRLDRQCILAVKEVEYLRAQLKMFDTEEAEMSPEKYDEQKAQRIASLESMIDEYRSELQKFRVDLEKAEQAVPTPSTPVPEPTGNKRSRISSVPDESSARHTAATKRIRCLQDEVAFSETARQLLERELTALRSQVESFPSSSSTRILEFRNNPTANIAAIKQSTLTTLRAENEALLARLESLSNPTSSDHDQETNDKHNTHSTRSSASTKLIPASTAERLRLDLADKDAQLAQRDKARDRLISSFKLRSLEFREAVASILGWKLDIMPNGRVRVRSTFDPVAAALKAKQRDIHRTKCGKEGRGGDEAEEGEMELDEERSIVFDGEAGTMKISGGPKSEFASEVRGHIEYWVDGRKEVPCFLAAVTMDFWEKGVGTVSV